MFSFDKCGAHICVYTPPDMKDSYCADEDECDDFVCVDTENEAANEHKPDECE